VITAARPAQDPHAGQDLLSAGEPLVSARAAMLLVHGRGASAADILSLADELDLRGFAYLAPQAAGYNWYPQRFIAPLEANQPWLDSALASLQRALDHIYAAGIPAERTVLLGFSQGACLVLEYSARRPLSCAGVVGLSGGLIGPQVDPQRYPGAFPETPVFLGCSDVDPHIPRERVEATAQQLRGMGAKVDLRLYPGMPHTVNDDELEAVRQMMLGIGQPV
jgi:predicted esterase